MKVKRLMLAEDLAKLDIDFPGAREFIEAAMKRHDAFGKIKKVQNDVINETLSDPACDEPWFVKKLKDEGLPTPKSLKSHVEDKEK